MLRALSLILMLMVAGCVLPGREAEAPGMVGDAVETTVLAPVGVAEVAVGPGVEAEPAAEEPVVAEPVAEEPAAEEPAEAPAEATAAEEPSADVAAAEPLVAPEPQSPEALACQRRGGDWRRVIPGSEARACVQRTRDTGDRCSSGRDCAGDCLARSGTCAPVTPLFGCHEILDETGRMMTQCID